MNSNKSGNRALNNTQKIGKRGAGEGLGVASNESGSDASLSQPRGVQGLGQTLAKINASIRHTDQAALAAATAPSSNSKNTSSFVR